MASIYSYQISGANRDSGEDVRIIIRANSEDEAIGQASSQGILVAECILQASSVQSMPPVPWHKPTGSLEMPPPPPYAPPPPAVVQEPSMPVNKSSPFCDEIMETQKHSGMGIASFIVSLVSAVGLFTVFAIAGVMESNTPGGIDEESGEAIMVGLFLLLFLGATVVGLGIGIAGLVQNSRNKLFAVLGTIFSAIAMVGTLLLMLMGMTME